MSRRLIPWAERLGRLLVTVFGALAGRTVSALVIDRLDPGREFGVEFLQAVGGIACQAQGGFKALLDTLDQALTFSFAPTMVGLGSGAGARPIGRRPGGVWALTKGLPWSV